MILAAAFGFSIAIISTKVQTRGETTFAIVFWMNLMQLPMTLLGSDPTFVAKLDAGMVLPVIGIVGWWFYGETLDVFVFVGAGLIIAGVLWNLRSEARRPRILGPARPSGS